jgi:hypothetical protein
MPSSALQARLLPMRLQSGEKIRRAAALSRP